MEVNLRMLKLLIVDEVSNLNLAYIHLRLEEIFGNSTNWFGSTNVLFVGDILQLLPVNGQPVFARLDNKAIGIRLGCMASVNIWRDTVVYDKLTINERQKNHVQFVKVLDEVRRGYPSTNVIECLKSKVIEGTLVINFRNCVNAVMF